MFRPFEWESVVARPDDVHHDIARADAAEVQVPSWAHLQCRVLYRENVANQGTFCLHASGMIVRISLEVPSKV